MQFPSEEEMKLAVRRHNIRNRPPRAHTLNILGVGETTWFALIKAMRADGFWA